MAMPTPAAKRARSTALTWLRREFEEFTRVDGFVGGICQDAQHRLYVCNGDVKRVEPDGAVSTYCDRAGEVPLTVANYPVFDAAGNLYVSNSGGWHKNDGWICKIAPGGQGEVWSRALADFPQWNGAGCGGRIPLCGREHQPPRGPHQNRGRRPRRCCRNRVGTSADRSRWSCFRRRRYSVLLLLSPGSHSISMPTANSTFWPTITRALLWRPRPTSPSAARIGRSFSAPTWGRWHIAQYDLGKTGDAVELSRHSLGGDHDLRGIDGLVLGFVRGDFKCLRHLVDSLQHVPDGGFHTDASRGY